ncbi:transcription-repair coupling factor, partial [Lactobacillus sp. XV13L]|nr:transcription-repair coupling factor [Lactobacillus sp. XV13L]
AYFMYRKDKTLSEVGEKRLEAVKNFTELGSGFKIAMRDLAIRGAGNLLGKQQHGFIDSVGYDLYTQMLAEAVDKKRGQKQQHPQTDAQVQLNLEAYIPASYITDERQKIEMYKRLRQVHSVDELMDLQQEFHDRFGKYPIEVKNLLILTRLKLLADQALIDKIKQQGQKLQLTFSPQANKYLSGEQIFQDLSLTSMKAQVANEHGYFIITFDP